jgi:HK97 family phage prohead protease
MTEIERRGVSLGVEVRAENDKRTLTGYAAVFNSPTDIGGYFTEQIAPGAFDSAMNADVRALVDHDSGRVIGRTKSGTLRLSQDSRGLKVEVDVPDTSDGNDLWTLVERGDISGMSFGFRVTKQEWDDTDPDNPKRTIQAVDLFEVSAVAFPAYDDTTLAARSLEACRAEADKAKADADKRAADAAETKRRLAEKRMTLAQRIRGIRQDAPVVDRP